MKIETLILGYLDNNCYILKKDNDCLIIDPASNGEEILKHIVNYNLLGILITHRHPDHIGALDYIVNKTKCKIIDLNEGFHNIGPFKFEVINTPGHTLDSKTFNFYNDNIMFTGDFIFKDTIGRTDMPGGSMDIMLKSLNKIKKYKNCRLLPGHGKATTLDYEKENNGYFNM